MADSLIRWSRSDYITLGKAISKFNKIKTSLENNESKLQLPDTLDYQAEKNRITTRRELNRFLNSIKNFSIPEMQETVTLDSGMEITKWEYQDMRNKARTTKRRLNKELASIDHVAKPYTTSQEKTIRANLKAIENWQNLKGQKYKNMQNRLNFFGAGDTEMRKAIVYRENYIEALQKYKNFDNFDKLMEKINSIKNPLEFYEIIKHNEGWSDVAYLWYKTLAQSAFNSMALEWGVELDKNSDILNNDILETQYEFYKKESKGEIEEQI